jgi:hypothetical protein
MKDPYKSPDKIVYDSATGSTFKEAFADARREGKKTFEWDGKKYGTKLKGEGQEDSTIKAGIAAGKESEGRTRTRPEDYEQEVYKKGRFENKMNRALGRATDPENVAKIKKYNETRKKDAEERAATAKSSNKAKENPETEDGVLPALGATGAALTAAALSRLRGMRGDKEPSLEKAATERVNRAQSGTSLRTPGASMGMNDPYSMTLGSELNSKRMAREGGRGDFGRGAGSMLREMNPQKLMKKGGKVSSASSRGDGIAQRGKTKGRVV